MHEVCVRHRHDDAEVGREDGAVVEPRLPVVPRDHGAGSRALGGKNETAPRESVLRRRCKTGPAARRLAGIDAGSARLPPPTIVHLLEGGTVDGVEQGGGGDAVRISSADRHRGGRARRGHGRGSGSGRSKSGPALGTRVEFTVPGVPPSALGVQQRGVGRQRLKYSRVLSWFEPLSHFARKLIR